MASTSGVLRPTAVTAGGTTRSIRTRSRRPWISPKVSVVAAEGCARSRSAAAIRPTSTLPRTTGTAPSRWRAMRRLACPRLSPGAIAIGSPRIRSATRTARSDPGDGQHRARSQPREPIAQRRDEPAQDPAARRGADHDEVRLELLGALRDLARQRALRHLAPHGLATAHPPQRGHRLVGDVTPGSLDGDDVLAGRALESGHAAGRRQDVERGHAGAGRGPD